MIYIAAIIILRKASHDIVICKGMLRPIASDENPAYSQKTNSPTIFAAWKVIGVGRFKILNRE